MKVVCVGCRIGGELGLESHMFSFFLLLLKGVKYMLPLNERTGKGCIGITTCITPEARLQTPEVISSVLLYLGAISLGNVQDRSLAN
jgi:hypothetical protein